MLSIFFPTLFSSRQMNAFIWLNFCCIMHFKIYHDFLGCYYQYQYYEEGEQIRTSEPCLNCTCHNQMLMCYLRVCPFIKPVGKNCVVEKRDDQCCPTIMCPQGKLGIKTTEWLFWQLCHFETGCQSLVIDNWHAVATKTNHSNKIQIFGVVRILGLSFRPKRKYVPLGRERMFCDVCNDHHDGPSFFARCRRCCGGLCGPLLCCYNKIVCPEGTDSGLQANLCDLIFLGGGWCPAPNFTQNHNK